MDSELRNHNLINWSSLYSDKAVSFAWHSDCRRFAVLTYDEPTAKRMSRSASSSGPTTPRRRGLMFGGNKSSEDDTSDLGKSRSGRGTVLSVYDVVDDGKITLVERVNETNDRIAHVFSGPFLGIVRVEECLTSTVGQSKASEVETSRKSFGESVKDVQISRPRRADSSSAMGNPITPTSSVALSNSTSSRLTFDTTNGGKKTYLEFYQWSHIPDQSNEDHERMRGGSIDRSGRCLVRVGISILCPITIQWEMVTKRHCALVYHDCIKIYRFSGTPASTLTCLHVIPTIGTARSIKWFKHILFACTNDAVMCYIVCRTRYFSIELANRFPQPSQGSEQDFPSPQVFPMRATTILGVDRQSLVLGGACQTLDYISLTNQVVQCCMLIALGQADYAYGVASSISHSATEWVMAVFEAFGFIDHALQLEKVSYANKINIGIKHNRVDDIVKILGSMTRDSNDMTGCSPFQRGCIALRRMAKQDDLLKLLNKLDPSLRPNDYTFLSSILHHNESQTQGLMQRGKWSSAMLVSNRPDKEELIDKWTSSLAAPHSQWRQKVESEELRVPNLTVAP